MKLCLGLWPSQHGLLPLGNPRREDVEGTGFCCRAVKPKEAQESIAELKAAINKDLDHKYLKNLNAERRCTIHPATSPWLEPHAFGVYHWYAVQATFLETRNCQRRNRNDRKALELASFSILLQDVPWPQCKQKQLCLLGGATPSL